MERERTRSSASQPSDVNERQRRNDAPTAWTIKHGDADFPGSLLAELAGTKFLEVRGIGDRSILKKRSLGLICSVQCPGSIVIQTFDAIRELRDAGIVVAGGFHSPMEKECLEFLLRGEQPAVVCPARGLGSLRMPASWRRAIDAGRLLLLSPFGNEVKRTTKPQAQARNEFVAALSAAVLVPHASPHGKAESVARHVLERGQPLFTFDGEENSCLLELGVRPYNIEEIRRLTATGAK